MSQDPDTAAKERFMRRAIAIAYEGMNGQYGGPFGAVIVKDGEIIAEAHNEVLHRNDPTAHAEVTAIRRASSKLRRFDLSDCQIYVNGMPCPMCMGAIFWSRLNKIYYACDAADAEAIGFDDHEFYRQLELPLAKRSTPYEQVRSCLEESRKCYQAWQKKDGKTPY